MEISDHVNRGFGKERDRKGKDKKRQYTANTTYHMLKPKMWVVGKRTWGHMSFVADAGVLWCPRHNMTVETEPSASRTIFIFFFLPDSVRCVFATGGSSSGIVAALVLCGYAYGSGCGCVGRAWIWRLGGEKKTYPKLHLQMPSPSRVSRLSHPLFDFCFFFA